MGISLSCPAQVELDGRLITDSVSIMLALEREFGGDKSLLPPGGVDDIRDLMGLERQLGSAWLGWLRAPPGVGGGARSTFEGQLSRVDGFLRSTAGGFFLGESCRVRALGIQRRRVRIGPV